MRPSEGVKTDAHDLEGVPDRRGCSDDRGGGGSAYRGQPGFIVARQGEQVTLEIIGINGADHVSALPPFVEKFTVKRGQITRVSFTAERAGVFPIICVNHQPSMTGYLT